MSLLSVWSRKATRRAQVPNGKCAMMSYIPLHVTASVLKPAARETTPLCYFIDQLGAGFEKFVQEAHQMEIMILVPRDHVCTRCVWDVEFMKKHDIAASAVLTSVPRPTLTEVR